ncbi:MAG: HAMP domain-containing protein, partial [Treponema sp.]|nr:HAMP domain-containing protein [Treponema sp.]
MEVSEKKVELSVYGAFEQVKRNENAKTEISKKNSSQETENKDFGYFSKVDTHSVKAEAAAFSKENQNQKTSIEEARKENKSSAGISQSSVSKSASSSEKESSDQVKSSASQVKSSPASEKSSAVSEKSSATWEKSSASSEKSSPVSEKSSATSDKTKVSKSKSPKKENTKKALKKIKKEEKLKALENKKALKRSSLRVRHPIGVKLISIISAIVVVALGGVTYAVSYFVSNDVKTSAEENNLAINSRTASDVESRIDSTVASVSMFLDLIEDAGSNITEKKSLENLFFDHNKSVVALYVQDTKDFFVSQAFFISREIESQDALNYFNQEADSFEIAKSGLLGLHNASSYFRQPVLSFFYPYLKNGKMSVAAFLYSADELSESFSSGSVNKSIFVNSTGELLLSNDISEMMSGKDESKNIVVQKMLESSQSNSQFSWKDENEKDFIGAFRKLSGGAGGVITTVETAIILEGVRATTRRNLYISVVILFIAILIIYFFARSMSTPLKQLTAIVNDINRGNFNTVLFSGLNTRRNDEIGVLARSTRNEREILNTFTTLTNKGVTEAIIRKEIDFNPHLKDITIFFSDIRGFTAISDGFKNRFQEKSAGEIISFLNDYMSRMVTCIKRTGGVVDKFEGDAIMAAWGVLRNESLDWEKLPENDPARLEAKKKHDAYVKRDALSAITSCIAMRYSLMLYNKQAEAFTKEHEGEPLAKYKPHIRIGAGLNSGRATVGFMGSNDKMEYTSIGDAVNFASRTEASNKPCGTDILIT